MNKGRANPPGSRECAEVFCPAVANMGLTVVKAGGVRKDSFSGRRDHRYFDWLQFTPTQVVLAGITGRITAPMQQNQLMRLHGKALPPDPLASRDGNCYKQKTTSIKPRAHDTGFGYGF